VFGGILEVSRLQMSLRHSETNVHPFWKWISSLCSYFMFFNLSLLSWCYYEIWSESHTQV
jgi:hypothetical protein